MTSIDWRSLRRLSSAQRLGRGRLEVHGGQRRARNLPRTLDEGCWGPAGEIYTRWQDSTHPAQPIALDGEMRAYIRPVLPAPDAPPGHPCRSIKFTSSDGQQIQGWLGLPDEESPFPSVIEGHGGLESAVTEDSCPSAQAWLDHGFAHLTVNCRGPTTFGRDFEERMWDDLEHRDIEDMVAARDWPVGQGIVMADQTPLTGLSYGGYLTLLGLVKRPELWAGGMAGRRRRRLVHDVRGLRQVAAGVLRGHARRDAGGKA